MDREGQGVRREGEGEGEPADLFDYGALKDYLGFVLRGLRRHRLLAFITFLLSAGLALGAAMLYPKSYRVQTKILAQRNQVLAALGNPHRSMPWDTDVPTRAAQETVLRRDNLVSLVQQTDLVERWQATRQPALRVKDTLTGLVRRKMDKEDRLDAMVGLLEKRLRVATDPTTVTISIEFPDAQLAYQIIELAQQNFLETQHVMEASAISEAISILEVHASQAHDAIEVQLQEVVRIRDERRKDGSLAVAAREASVVRDPEPVKPRRTNNDAELTQLRFLIRAKRRAIGDLEEFRSRRLTELNAQLAEQRVQYSNQHPVVLDTQQRVAAMQQPSPQVVALKRDEAELVAEYGKKGGGDPVALAEPVAATRTPRHFEIGLTLPDPALTEDPEVSYADSQLRTAQAKYDELVMRIDAARIELDTARAAFKYRFSVLNPAQLPKAPSKPNVPVLVLLGLAVAAVLSLFVGAATDLWHGRIVEPWQVARGLRVPVLAEVGRK
ncbi:MAG: GumC domain-containing protein [Myxococcaceae bacterium]